MSKYPNETDKVHYPGGCGPVEEGGGLGGKGAPLVALFAFVVEVRVLVVAAETLRVLADVAVLQTVQKENKSND